MSELKYKYARGKVAVVTGGSKGIGAALVLKLTAEGFKVLFCAREKEFANELIHRAKTMFPDGEVPVFYPADLSSNEGTKDFCNRVIADVAAVDVLVNNAGYFIPGAIHSEEEGTLERMIETNLYSAYYVTRRLLPTISKPGGFIVNMCSTASFVPYVNGGSYCISKFALLGMSKVLREEMKPYGIRVTSVMPGATLTASWAGTELPEDRFMAAEDVAEMILAAWRISDRSDVEELVMRPLLGDL